MGLDIDKIADDFGLPRDKFREGVQRIQREQKAVGVVCWSPGGAYAHLHSEEGIKPTDKLFTFPPATLSAVPDSFDALIVAAKEEAHKAMAKFPQPNYVISKIAEEAGEVVRDAIHLAEGRQTVEKLRGEMKQTIAMLYRLWIEGDQVHGCPPAAPAHPASEKKGAKG